VLGRTGEEWTASIDRREMTMKRSIRMPSPAMVVSLAALVMSTGGTVTAAALITSANIKNNTIRSVDVRNGTLTGTDVRDNSLTSTDVRNGSLTGADLANNAINSAKIADGTLTGTDLANNAVNGAKVADDSLTGAHISEATLGQVPTAADATTLNGLAANQLVRATSTSLASPVDNFDTCIWTTMLETAVTAPTDGILLVWGTITAAQDASSPNRAALHGYVSVDGRSAGPVHGVVLDHNTNVTMAGNIAVSGAISVAEGEHAVVLSARECDSGMAWVASGSMTTLFVPFGNAGQPGVLAGLGAEAVEPMEAPLNQD